jgi:large subunit ribosomal protein L4
MEYQMKAKLYNLDKTELGEIDINDNIFGLIPSESILNQVVNWQRSKKQAGTHSTKGRSDVEGTTKKPHKQKGTGKARLGSLRAAQCRGGGVIFGPTPRSHEHGLPKKVRKLGLKMALSAKFSEGKLMFVDSVSSDISKTKEISAKLSAFGNSRVLVIDSNENESNILFTRAIKNIINIDILWQIGANVYDILNHDQVIITEEAMKFLEERLV